MSFGRWGRVLPAHMRKGFTRVSQHGVDFAGYSLSCSVGLAGLWFFLFDCPLLILAGIVLPDFAPLLAFLSDAVRAVDAFLDRTLGVCFSVGFPWRMIGYSGCVVRYFG